MASQNGHLEVVVSLLKSGADKNIRTRRKKTALDLAEKSSIIKALSA